MRRNVHGWTWRAHALLLAQLSLYPGLAGTSYYVATNGNNSNSGLRVNKPFATLSYALTVATYGDTIYVRRGTYREGVWLEPPNRPNLNTGLGSWENMLTITRYADEQPVIKGSVVVTGWALESGAIWKRDNWTVRSQQVFDNGLALQQIGWTSPKFTNPAYYTQVGSGLGDMYPGTFYHDTNNSVLYVWLADGGDPTQPDRLVEASVRDPFHAWYEFIHVKGLAFCHANDLATTGGWPGVSIWRRSIFEDCDVQWCDYNGFSARDESRVIRCNFSHHGAMGCGFAGTNMLIVSNTFLANNYRGFSIAHESSGMKIIGVPDMRGTVISHNEVGWNQGVGIWCDTLSANSAPFVIRDNYVHHNTYGVMLEMGTNFLCYNNLVVSNQQRGLYMVGTRGSRAHNNTLISAPYSYALLELNAGYEYGRQVFAVNNTLSNNVLCDPAQPRQVTVIMARGSGNTNNHFDHNCYFATNGPLLFSINDYVGNDFWRAFSIGFADWQTNQWDLHGFQTDPLFVDGDNLKLWPWLNSPVVGAGANLSGLFTTDIENQPRPDSGPFTLGAYEFVLIDTDGDGLEDDWETRFGLDPNHPGDGAADADADSYSNQAEYERNTDPTSALSGPATLYALQSEGSDSLTGLYPVRLNPRHGPKQTMAGAANAAMAGDCIQVLSGNYNETVNIRGQPIRLIMAGTVNMRTP